MFSILKITMINWNCIEYHFRLEYSIKYNILKILKIFIIHKHLYF